MITNNLKKYRKANHLTQQQLADMLGKTVLTIKRYENNDIKIPASVQEKLSVIFEVPAGKLFKIHDIDFYSEIHDIFHSLGCSYQKPPDSIKILITKPLKHASLLCQFNATNIQKLIEQDLDNCSEHIKLNTIIARPFIEIIIANILIKYIDELCAKNPDNYYFFTNANCIENNQEKEVLIQWKKDLENIRNRDISLKNHIITFFEQLEQSVNHNIAENIKIFCKTR